MQDQENMPQIILKERTAHLASYTFLQEMLINTKTRHFHSSINHLFHRTFITSYFHPVNIAKFLQIAFLQNTSGSSHLQMFFGLKACNFIKKRLQHRCFPVKFKKILRTPFLQNTSHDCFCTSGGCFCIFLKK